MMSVSSLELSADVAIVGFGPTGATLASLLIDRGVSVVVADRLDDLYPHPRAAGIDHEGMRILQRAGVTDGMQDSIAPYRPSEYQGVSGQLIQRMDSAPPPYRNGWNPNYVFDQPKMEGLLRDKVEGNPRATVLLGTDVHEYSQDENGCKLLATDIHSGRGVVVSAQYVVACDGGASPTRSFLGIGLEDHGFHQPWLVIDAEVSDEAVLRLPQTQVQYCRPDRPTTYIVLVGNLRRWEIRLDNNDIPKGTAISDAQAWEYLEQWITPEDAKIRRAAAYTFHGLTAQSWREGRYFLAGDAAHMTPPFMTQGMVQGLRDADNLAWKLADVVQRRSPESLLETYEEERRPHVRQTTAKAIELGRVIGERSHDAALKRDQDMLAAQGGRVESRLRQNYIPSLQSGLIASGSPGAGELIPQPTVLDETGNEVRFDDIAGQRFIVVMSYSESGELPDRTKLAALDATAFVITDRRSHLHRLHEGAATEIFDSAGLIGQWLNEKDATFAVVRPDKYVFGTASTTKDLDRLLDDAVSLSKLAACSSRPMRL